MVVVINYLSVLVAAVVGFVIGSLWYTVLFGKVWMKLMEFSPKQLAKNKKKGMMGSMIFMFISILVMAYVVDYLLIYTGGVNMTAGAMLGFWVWLGFVATTMTGQVLWEGKSWKLYFINVAHYLVVLIVMGAILAAWR